MKMVLCFLTIILAYALPASANPRNPKPDWVAGSSMEYSRDLYVTGVGSADDRSTAEDRARGEITRFFSSKVTVNSGSEASEAASQSTGNKAQNASSQSVTLSVKTVSNKILEGVEIVETWQDDTSRVWYALAILDKAKAISALSEKLAGVDAQIIYWNDQMKQATEKFPKVKAGMKLLSLFKVHSLLESDLRVLSGKGLPMPVDEAAARSLAIKSLADLDVAIIITGVKSREVETGVITALAGLELQATAGSLSKVDLIVTGEVEVNPMETGDSQWKFARSHLIMNVMDGSTKKIFLQFQATEKGSSGDYDTAIRRSLDNLSKKAALQISAGVIEYFENQ